MKTVAFETLGCKLNFSETSSMKRDFMESGYEIRDFSSPSDVYIINTCSVTADANSACRKTVRQASRRNPEAFIAVIGCYAQLKPKEIASIPGVDVVLGAADKFRILELFHSFKKQDKTLIYHSDVNEAADFHHAFSSDDRTRAFLKVQDGCDYKCAFCTIPLARGQSRSPQITTVIKNAARLVDEGFKEIILTGVNAGDFGKQHGESFLELLQAMDSLDGIERIRISSIEPNLLDDEIIRLAASSKKIQPHFHIPLQSGSNEMLRMMRRRYRTELYAHKVHLIKHLMPQACIGVDVITGHPGETEELFLESFNFIESLDVSYLHVFTYSERPDTQALSLSPVIPVPARKARTHALRRLSKQKKSSFDKKFAKEILPVLFEQTETGGFIYGWTNNYVRVRTPYQPGISNSIIPVKLVSYSNKNNCMDGEIVKTGDALLQAISEIVEA